MAGNSSGTVPSLSRAASRNQATSQKSLTRRVSFNESNLKHIESNDSSLDQEAQHRGKCGSRCNMCCALVSMALGMVVIILLIVGVVFFAFLQSNLPEFSIHRLDINKINTTTSKNKETLLTGDFDFMVNVTNKNKKVMLSYGDMDVDASANDVSLGGAHIPHFEQNPLTGTDLHVKTGVSKAPVSEGDAKELMWNAERHTMVIKLSFKGTISFVINGKEMSSLPLKVSCNGIEQTAIDQGDSPECNVKITPFS